MHIENIVIGKPVCDEWMMFSSDDKTGENDWENVEKDKTYYTDERFLPKILVDIGVYPSISEIKRNRPDLMISFDKINFIDKLKVGKKKWVWILVGE